MEDRENKGPHTDSVTRGPDREDPVWQRSQGCFTYSRGRCHCGAVRATVTLTRALSTYAPRSCDCDYCSMQGIAYLSDPEGELAIEVREPSALAAYRQGTDQARFLRCARCGIVIAVVCAADGVLHGALNARTLENRADLAEAETVSPRLLPGDERLARWSRLWFPRVTGVPSGL